MQEVTEYLRSPITAQHVEVPQPQPRTVLNLLFVLPSARLDFLSLQFSALHMAQLQPLQRVVFQRQQHLLVPRVLRTLRTDPLLPRLLQHFLELLQPEVMVHHVRLLNRSLPLVLLPPRVRFHLGYLPVQREDLFLDVVVVGKTLHELEQVARGQQAVRVLVQQRKHPELNEPQISIPRVLNERTVLPQTEGGRKAEKIKEPLQQFAFHHILMPADNRLSTQPRFVDKQEGTARCLLEGLLGDHYPLLGEHVHGLAVVVRSPFQLLSAHPRKFLEHLHSSRSLRLQFGRKVNRSVHFQSLRLSH